MVDTRDFADYPTKLTGSLFWTRKLRTMFRRLDLVGHGYLLLDDLLDVATGLCANLPDAAYYKGDAVVNSIVELWYTVFASQVEQKQRTEAHVNEAMFVSSMQECLNNMERREAFAESFCNCFFDAVDNDNDGKITNSEYKTLMKAWRVLDKDSDMTFRLTDADRDGKITKEEFRKLSADYFLNEDMKSKIKQMWGVLVTYKRPEDYPELDCGTTWESKMRTMFRRMDVSGATKIKCRDFIQIARKIILRGRLDKHKSDAVMRAMLNVWVKFMSIDKDGKHYSEMTEKEFIKNFRGMINGDFRHELDQFGWTFFKAMETDGNGYVSLQEFRNLQEAWGVGREESEAMFKTIDMDKDGKLSSEEYLTAWVQYFLTEDHSNPYSCFFGPVTVKHEAR